MEAKFNHFDHNGNAVMVDVSDKAVTERTAVASGKIRVNDAVMQAILQGTAKKGDVLAPAKSITSCTEPSHNIAKPV